MNLTRSITRSPSHHGRTDVVETPDLDRIADVCLARVYEVRKKGLIAEHSVIVEQLRQIWNARGAADIAHLRDAGFALERALQMLDY